MRQSQHHRTPRRVRWTPIERALIVFSLLLMIGSTGVELYQWVNPTVAPAAPRAQDQATPTLATETPTVEAATATPDGASPSEIPTVEPPTATSEPPTATSEPPTATPVIEFGSTPLPTFTPLPTLVIGTEPLVLEKTASGRSAKVGGQFSYFITVRTNSTDARSVEVRDTIDPQLEVIEASSTSGSCSTANLVVCVLKVSRDAPAQVIINVRVRGNTVAGAVLVSQALARDDRRETAASERVTVTVEGAVSQVVGEQPAATAPPTATATEQPARPSRPAPTVEESTALPAAPTETVAEPTAATEAVAAVNAAPTNTTVAEVIAQAATAQPTLAVPATTAPQRQQPTPALPPTLAPIGGDTGAGPVNPSAASPVLPHTGASIPTFGFGVGLMGLALTLHGTRRVRRADARFSNESEKFSELSPLVHDAVDLQHTTVNEIERMRQQSEEMRKLLER